MPNATTDMVEVFEHPIRRDSVSSYVAADVDIGEDLHLTSGLRYDNFVSNEATTLSPRATLKYDVLDNLSVSGTAGRHTLQSRGVEFLRGDLGPEDAMHYVVGVDHRIANGVELTVTAYLKDLIVHDASLVVDNPSEGFVNRGTGRSKGAEAMLRVRKQDWFGWLSYGLMRSERKDTMVR